MKKLPLLVIIIFAFGLLLFVAVPVHAEDPTPSPSPTASPSVSPSPSPTASPTASPTPSLSPSPSATDAATGGPDNKTAVLGATDTLGETSAGIEIAKWVLAVVIGLGVIAGGLRVAKTIKHSDE